MSELRDATIDAVAQFRTLLLTLKAATRDGSRVYERTGIGRHVRHVTDHFRAFADGLYTGEIDYNKRTRGSPIETRLDVGLSEIEWLIAWLADASMADIPIDVLSEVSALSSVNERFSSRTRRELLYLINHSIHHVAYARLLARNAGIDSDSLIGVAPATATFLRRQGQRL